MKRVVTERELIERINRRLADDGQKLFKTSLMDSETLGNYHVFDFSLNVAVNFWTCRLADIGREFDVINDDEEIVDD